jgi:hypothetical protein
MPLCPPAGARISLRSPSSGNRAPAPTEPFRLAFEDALFLKGLSMTPQFLRSEAARFREMAESVTDREASRQRLLNMALDYEARAAAADAASPPAPAASAEPEPEREPRAEPEPEQAPDSGTAPDIAVRPRVGRRTTLRATRTGLGP